MYCLEISCQLRCDGNLLLYITFVNDDNVHVYIKLKHFCFDLQYFVFLGTKPTNQLNKQAGLNASDQ